MNIKSNSVIWNLRNISLLFSHCSKYYFFVVLCILLGCKKIVHIGPPVNSITTTQVFKDSTNAASAIAGIYSKLNYSQFASSKPGFGNGVLTEYGGLSADELGIIGATENAEYFSNILTAQTNGLNLIWDEPYNIIYAANACIESINSSSFTSQTKNQFLGEAKFLRALCYFYLVNLYGDVPLITSINWDETAAQGRSSKSDIYQWIINDLKESQSLLREDYLYSNDERVRANKLAATALLARTYLYNENWEKAELESSSLITNPILDLNPDLNSVFLKNNPEAILQWHLNTSVSPWNATREGHRMIPDIQPNYFVTEQLISSFDSGDLRKSAWLGTTNYDGIDYFFPYKYKIAFGSPNETATEYYMILRLAEQYLIRAEARAQQNKLVEAISDLNRIRTRAGLPDLPNSLNQTQVLEATEKERRIELFVEWGHRWFDLKRTGRIDAIMGIQAPMKSGESWQSYRQLFPIRSSELERNPFLVQNPGYN